MEDTHIFSTSTVSSTVRASLDYGDDLFVAAGVTLGNTEGTAVASIHSDTFGHRAYIDGSLIGAYIGIRLGIDGVGSENALIIRTTGQIIGMNTYGASMHGHGSYIENAGYVYGGIVGLQMATSQNQYFTSTIINSGIIEGRDEGISRRDRADLEKIELKNSGIIKGKIYSYHSEYSNAVDEIVNTGKMYGRLHLDGGNDVYDGRFGYIDSPIAGGDGNDAIYGGKEDNIISGGDGDDFMAGGGGNDTYYVSSAGDRIVEASGQGVDSVVSDVSFVLPENFENLDLWGVGNGRANLNGTGNSLDNILIGNPGNNRLDGKAGNDRLDGDLGADQLIGGSGNDTYVVDDVGDMVVEAVNGGTDRVISSIGFSLARLGNVEHLRLSGSASIDATGNSLANVLEGNTGSNTLRGNSGNDTLNGAAGSDKLYGGSGADALTGGTGQDIFVFDTALGAAHIDRITDFSGADDTIWLDDAVFTKAGRIGDLKASAFHIGSKAHDGDDRIIYDKAAGKLFYDADGSGSGAAVQFATIGKNLALTANDFDVVTAMNVLRGGTGPDTLTAGSGNDRIYGNLGSDTLTGGAGKDTFVFDTKPSSTNIDTIKDFSVADDTIWLDNAVFNKAGAVGDLKTEAFCVGTKAKDASDRVIYDKATGKLWYDADGNGKSAAIQIALLTKNLSLTASDFDIIG